MKKSSIVSSRLRRDYGSIHPSISIPDLIDIQKSSYNSFLNVDPHSRFITGKLYDLLDSMFPIVSRNKLMSLQYNGIICGDIKHDVDESKHRGSNYSVPIKINLQLVTYETSDQLKVKDVKEQEIYLCDLPLMTENGTFIINGTERVIVSQLHRAQGVFFDSDKTDRDSSIGQTFGAYVVPERGSWLDIEIDARDIVYARIDKRKKFCITSLLRCMNVYETDGDIYNLAVESNSKHNARYLDNAGILKYFYNTAVYSKVNGKWTTSFNSDMIKHYNGADDIFNADTGELIVQAGAKVTAGLLKKLNKSEIKNIVIPESYVVGTSVSSDLHIEGNLVLRAGDHITEEALELINENNITTIEVVLATEVGSNPCILNTIIADKDSKREESISFLYNLINSSEMPSIEAGEHLIYFIFENPARYDISKVGRFRINKRFGLDNYDDMSLRAVDVFSVTKYLIGIKDGIHAVEDVDHLGNRRIRSSGELIESYIKAALLRVEKNIQERMDSNLDEFSPYEIVNTKPVQASIKDFFSSSQLSQFMDQTNPLSGVTHRRRISALGPKGLTRDRASFEVRDVHTSHYGRICPIETPEGPNIGLINSLSTYTKVDEYGFLETPYQKVENSVITDEVVYLNANMESNLVIAQSTVARDGNKIVAELVDARCNGEHVTVKPEVIDYIDVSPRQIVSIATSMVPFLENNDANRALMGANMQRQAVPLIKSEAPVLSTGIEGVVARDSGVCLLAKNQGIVEYVDSQSIFIKSLNENNETHGVDVYKLKKFNRSNHDTLVHQKPIVSIGQRVAKGDIIADGQSVDKGELALGKNVLVAFMPWDGYNFEDSVLISERIVKDDVFTSVHIEELEVSARDTKLGAEEITVDLPNVSDSAIKNLDESGIVNIGSIVSPGDILVGKITPKAESIVTPEEKLLRAIFGKKAATVKDTSLKVPVGVSGSVVGVHVFSKKGEGKDSRAHAIERKNIETFKQELNSELNIIDSGYKARVLSLLNGCTTTQAFGSLSKGATINAKDIEDIHLSGLFKILINESGAAKELQEIYAQYQHSCDMANNAFNHKIENIKKGDDLPPGVLKVVKVFIAIKRRIQPGDKIAGRHGNKGVISRILPVEDMPYLEDGTPVDFCLNPLGVPSRMNIGQILETHVGWASYNIGNKIQSALDGYYSDKDVSKLKDELVKYFPTETSVLNDVDDKEIIGIAKDSVKGIHVSTPVFDGMVEKDVNNLLTDAGVDTSGQVTLIDGRTGDPFDMKVTVGYMYILKLHHLVDNKIHARSVGPYSLITQQPLGGKAQFGGQRFGEMEVWAMQAYGAAYSLQEMLTVKSDDQAGRVKAYEAIIKGNETFSIGTPESFNVLTKELRSLCLDLQLKKKD